MCCRVQILHVVEQMWQHVMHGITGHVFECLGVGRRETCVALTLPARAPTLKSSGLSFGLGRHGRSCRMISDDH